jgi:hypothetical protein
MADRFFQKIANDVLEASEKLTARFEEGLTALFTGGLPAAAENKEVQPDPDGEVPESEVYPSSSFEDEVHLLESEGGYGESPLEGIARGVIGSIMDNQVRLLFLGSVVRTSSVT